MQLARLIGRGLNIGPTLTYRLRYFEAEGGYEDDRLEYDFMDPVASIIPAFRPGDSQPARLYFDASARYPGWESALCPGISSPATAALAKPGPNGFIGWIHQGDTMDGVEDPRFWFGSFETPPGSGPPEKSFLLIHHDWGESLTVHAFLHLDISSYDYLKIYKCWILGLLDLPKPVQKDDLGNIWIASARDDVPPEQRMTKPTTLDWLM